MLGGVGGRPLLLLPLPRLPMITGPPVAAAGLAGPLLFGVTADGGVAVADCTLRAAWRTRAAIRSTTEADAVVGAELPASLSSSHAKPWRAAAARQASAEAKGS